MQATIIGNALVISPTGYKMHAFGTGCVNTDNSRRALAIASVSASWRARLRAAKSAGGERVKIAIRGAAIFQ
jgi:hypothetical protein